MKIAVSAAGKDLNATIDPRFGRCAYFLIVDTEDMNAEAFPNESITLGGGAGIQSAQFISSKGAEILITGNCGPNAMRTLSAAGIKVILDQGGIIREAVDRFKRGELKAAADANVPPHSGAGGGMGGGRGMKGRMGRD
jgi:predicted Fe-Mo cluster-binding NifX family protein